MAPPTLGRKGKLRDPLDRADVQAKLDDIVPIDYVMDWFRTHAAMTGVGNRVLILKAMTASGKSTYLLGELYKRLIRTGSAGSGSAVCTQPRVLTAIRNVMEILKHYGDTMRLGDNIGWSTGEDKVPTRGVGVMSVTVGTLTMELKTQPDEVIMSKYRYIFVDETHERSIDIDLALYMLKGLLTRNASNARCPFVVCMSATFDAAPFVRYFIGSDAPDAIERNHILVEGARAYDIVTHWDWNEGRIVNDVARGAAECVRAIVTAAPDEPSERADVLIFMPGRAEIDETRKRLGILNVELARADRPVFAVLGIDSEAQRTRSHDYQMIDVPVGEQRVRIAGRTLTPARRVIISTNVAETGLTLENLKYVIDAGFNKETEFNPNLAIHSLVVKPAPQSRIIQRKGRAGRNFPGEFYPLYPQYVYDRLPRQQLPQILLDDITRIFVDIAREQMRDGAQFDPRGIDMIDPPSSDALRHALDRAYRLGIVAIEPAYRVTDVGALVSALRLPLESSRMILSAFAHECSIIDMITIAVYLDSDVRGKNADGTKGSVNWQYVYGHFFDTVKIAQAQARLAIADEFMDGLVLIEAFKLVLVESYKNPKTSVAMWCERATVDYAAVMEMLRVRDDVIEQALTAGIAVFHNEQSSFAAVATNSSKLREMMDIVTRIKYCVYDGYRCNTLTLRDGVYTATGGIAVRMPVIFTNTYDAAGKKAAPFRYSVETLPRILVYSKLELKKIPKDPLGMYSVRAQFVSQMDGFVHVDDAFAL